MRLIRSCTPVVIVTLLISFLSLAGVLMWHFDVSQTAGLYAGARWVWPVQWVYLLTVTEVLLAVAAVVFGVKTLRSRCDDRWMLGLLMASVVGVLSLSILLSFAVQYRFGGPIISDRL